MRIGWNLGNTFDSVDHSSEKRAINEYEQLWGSPEVTKELIDSVKKAGFTIIRIPVTWNAHIGAAPNYKINSAWISRVRDIVDYAIDENVCAIINLHHESWYTPDENIFESAADKLYKVWTQIADAFSEYDERLIFEGMNEPRLIGSEHEWDGGTASAHSVINKLNRVFVEAVRSRGGINSVRKLMIPTYAASCYECAIDALEIPDDNNIIVSIHAYIPYDFALNISGTSSWDVENHEDTQEIEWLMDKLYEKFVSVGIPVIIGEFGAVDKDNINERMNWSEFFVSCAIKRDISCIWWDNCIFNGDGEKFGLYDRDGEQWVYPGVVEALMNGLKNSDKVLLT